MNLPTTTDMIWRLEPESVVPYTIVRATDGELSHVDPHMMEPGDYMISERNGIFDLSAKDDHHFTITTMDHDGNEIEIDGKYADTGSALAAILNHAI